MIKLISLFFSYSQIVSASPNDLQDYTYYFVPAPLAHRQTDENTVVLWYTWYSWAFELYILYYGTFQKILI